MIAREEETAEADEHASVTERLARQFYSWEQWGRGWMIWDGPVRPEPPFRQFNGYFINRQAAHDDEDADDGRHHTVLSRLVRWLSRTLAGQTRQEPQPAPEADDPVPELLDESEPIVEIRAQLPSSFSAESEVAEQFILSLVNCRHPLAFEVIGLPEETRVQLAVRAADVPDVGSQLVAHFPDVTRSVDDDSLAKDWSATSGQETAVVEFGLSREFMLPLASARGLGADPLVGILGAMEDIGPGEIALLQVLFEPVHHPWAGSILRSVVGSNGDALFSGPVDILRQTKEKVSRPLYAAVVRIACRSSQERRAWDVARRLAGTLAPLSDPSGNELIPLENDEYAEDLHIEDVPLRRCRRSGMILSSAELVSLVHLPSAAVQSPKLKRGTTRTKAAPASILGHALVLGENQHAGQARRVTLNPDQRVRHTHVIGASGTGKSTLLLNLILQDIGRGEGLAVLDPHGDLIDAILGRIPENRIADVVLFDPSDEEYPVGFNILAAHSEAEKTLLASDLVGIFRRLSTSWGDQMNAVLSNGVLAMLESDHGGTLADLRRFLVEPPFRAQFLESVRDPQVVYYWRKEFPLLVGKPQGPVLTRLDAFLRPKAIRNSVAQRANRLNFAEIMDYGRIFLARLSHGAVGEENAHLLGALLVSKFNQLAMGRQQVKASDRRDFWLYIDEFQHFATPSMASLLSGVRKYRLGLILAHQELRQLESRSADVASAVLSNAYARVCFRVGDQDARKLAEGFMSFEASDLQKLGTGEAICRVERADFDFNLHVEPVGDVDEAMAASTRDRALSASRQRYAVPRQLVEEELRVRMEEAIEPAASREPRPSPPPPAPPKPMLPVTIEPANSSAPILPASGEGTSKPVRRREKERSVAAADPAPMGRGGPEHKYLQQLIKQWAEGMGYRASIEKAVLGRRGVDVALEKEGMSIACEISVTTSEQWELGNVRKCLSAGFAHVMMVCPDSKQLAKLRKGIEQELVDEERARVHFFLPDEMFAYVEELEVQSLEQEQTVRGYKVKRSFRTMSAAERSDRREVVARVVAGAVKRRRERK